jgi:hypothetical protein
VFFFEVGEQGGGGRKGFTLEKEEPKISVNMKRRQESC